MKQLKNISNQTIKNIIFTQFTSIYFKQINILLKGHKTYNCILENNFDKKKVKFLYN